MNKKFLITMSLLAIFVLILSSCATATAEPKVDEPTVEPTIMATEVPQPEGGSGGGTGGGGGNGSGGGSGADSAETSSEDMTDAAMKITGKVDQEQAWTEDEVKAMPSIDAESTNSKGESATYTGVLISDLLNLAVPKPNAETLVFVADDGYTAEIALTEVMNCADCILSFRSNGGFSSVLPGFEKNLQVKGVVELQVK